MGFQNLAVGVDVRVQAAGSYSLMFVLVDQPSEHRSTPDSLAVQAGRRMIGVWRLKSQRSMWTPAVVVKAVSGEDGP